MWEITSMWQELSPFSETKHLEMIFSFYFSGIAATFSFISCVLIIFRR